MKMKNIYLSIAIALSAFSACSTKDEELVAVDDSQIIHVGGVSTDGMMTTAVTRTGTTLPAEEVDWLAAMLQQGMDITYLTKTAQKTAQLVLATDANGDAEASEGGFTVYQLNAYDEGGNLTTVPAKWLDNGVHTFQGVYVPEGLKAAKTTKTHEDLSRYTAVPPMANISATVGRITIPLQHRLARVEAYVLIEPGMGATLKGYDSKNLSNNENVENTMLRFCNVWTLDSVNVQGQPVWMEERKAIPHYMGEEEVILYTDKSSGELIFPTDAGWTAAHQDYQVNGENGKYACTNYGRCPYYDLIVRPTYTVRTDGSNVMYDEANPTASLSNNIDFELTLNNDLEYEKKFTFDLNANDETVVYLRVAPERIDYNSAGSRLWKETNYGNFYYGVNNQNGNNLSVAGSSWQRAYTNSTLSEAVTDGHFYDADEEDLEAQYVSDDKWIELFFQACKDSVHHGDYFILDHDIMIPASAIPADFVFTGHLDGMDHTITIEGGSLLNGLNGIYTTRQETDQNAVWEANVHKEGQKWVPTSGWRAEVVNTVISGGSLFSNGATVSGYVNNCKDQNGWVNYQPTTIPIY